MKEQENIELLSNDLLHENGQTEQARLDCWKKEHTGNGNLHDILTRIGISPKIDEYAESQRENILIQLNSRIDKTALRLRRLKFSAAAAAILLLLAISNYVSYKEGYKKLNSQSVTLDNPLGIRSSIVLPDGSKVILNAGSSLTYPNAFTEKTREISLKGEAFFEVARDVAHPFIVKAEEIQVKVLGTKFNIKAYEDENNIEVALSEGSVCVGLEKGNTFIQMEPEQLVQFDKTKKTFSKQAINLNNYIAWKDGKFYFNRITFGKIARQLERNFNVHIHIASDKLRNTAFTGDFVRGENLEQILRIMTFDKRIKYQIEGDQVYIREK